MKQDQGKKRDRRKTPLNGYLFRALKTSPDGAPYVDPVAASAPDGSSLPGGSCTHAVRFGFCAWPARYGIDGVWTFFVTEEAVVWRRDLGPAGRGLDVCPRIKPDNEEWERADGTRDPVNER